LEAKTLNIFDSNDENISDLHFSQSLQAEIKELTCPHPEGHL